jgi:hypothetical protein
LGTGTSGPFGEPGNSGTPGTPGPFCDFTVSSVSKSEFTTASDKYIFSISDKLYFYLNKFSTGCCLQKNITRLHVICLNYLN